MTNQADLKRFPEHPQMDPPKDYVEDCAPCGNWGVVLGTDSPDSWGDPCDCGREMVIPRTLADSKKLHAAHMQARLRAENRQ